MLLLLLLHLWLLPGEAMLLLALRLVWLLLLRPAALIEGGQRSIQNPTLGIFTFSVQYHCNTSCLTPNKITNLALPSPKGHQDQLH